MTTSGLVREIAQRFSRAGLHFGHGTRNAKEEAVWLVSSVMGLPLNLEKKIAFKDKRTIEALVQRRIRERIPLAYMLKEAWLGEHSFYIDKRAVVPRSFVAELLRDRLSPWLAREPRRALDLGTGSGCLAILLALEFTRARVDAADLSSAALQVSRINIRKHGVGKRVRAIRSDLFRSLGKQRYDLIVSNPPYVTARSMRRLPREYRHEPSLALAAGRDGLDLVRRILAQAKQHLTPGGLLVCEIGGNRKALERVYPELAFTWPETSEGPGCVFILEREQLPRLLHARRVGACGMRPRRAPAKR